jgi:hypothetical protein
LYRKNKEKIGKEKRDVNWKNVGTWNDRKRDRKKMVENKKEKQKE